MSNQIRHVKLTELLVEQISSLYMSEKCSDITLFVEGQKIPAHSSIIGARCEYLNKFFATDLNKPNQTKFELNVQLKPFQVLLEYFYTGQINLSKIKDVKVLLQIFNLVEEYCLFHLKTHFEKYCNEILSVENVFQFLEAARIYELKELENESLNIIESYPDQILASDSFKKISKKLLKEILTKDSFCACSELYLFNAVIEWSKQTNENIETVLHLINLSEIPLKELLKIRNSETLTEKKIFDAIEKQMTIKPLQRQGFRKCNENVATSKYNAKTIEDVGIYMASELLNGNCVLYNDTTGYTRHTISQSNNTGIIVELEKIFSINHIKILLWDRNNRTYSYFIEISTDQKKWKRLIDYSSYACRSWQNLYFPVKPVKYIKVVGTHCSANNYFDIVTLEAYYKENIPVIRNGFLVPKHNVALDSLGATVTKKNNYFWGDSKSLLSGDPYQGGISYEIHNGRSITIKLNQPFQIDSIRLLLDCESKFYIETSLNLIDWEEVVNNRNKFVNFWQSFQFPSRPVLYIRIICVDINSGIKLFKISHFECPIEKRWKINKYLLTSSVFFIFFSSVLFYYNIKKYPVDQGITTNNSQSLFYETFCRTLLKFKSLF